MTLRSLNSAAGLHHGDRFAGKRRVGRVLGIGGLVVVLVSWAVACSRTGVEGAVPAGDGGKDANAANGASTHDAPADNGSCPSGETLCTDCASPGSPSAPCPACVDEQTDPNHCGACGSICSADTPLCVEGVCSVVPMPNCAPGGPGLTNCGAGGSGSESCCTSLEVNGEIDAVDGGGGNDGGDAGEGSDGADGGDAVGGNDGGDAGEGTDGSDGGDAGEVGNAGISYYRTYTNDGEGGAAGEANPATVSGFRLDKYLVTVGRFRQFVAAWSGGYYPSSGSGKHTHLNGGQGLMNSGSPGTYETGWDAADWNNTTDIDPTDSNLASCSPYSTWTTVSNGQENLPINCVNWWEAYAFCIWDGGFLPSEAEWECAAAGGSQQREYPWGETAPGTTNQYAIYGLNYSANPIGIAPVGTASLGAGFWGQFDLAGDVSEWNLDDYAPYAPCADCAYLTTAASRVLRGGSFSDRATALLPPARGNSEPTGRGGDVGIRCARTP